MRPAPGASTMPSFICWAITLRSPPIASSVRRATSKAVRAESTRTCVRDALGEQLVGAVEVGLRLVDLRLLRLDACVERLHLQHQLGVGDRRQLGPGLGAVAFLGLERNDRAADAGAGDELADRLDGGDDRLLVLDLDRVDHKRIGRDGGLG